MLEYFDYPSLPNELIPEVYNSIGNGKNLYPFSGKSVYFKQYIGTKLLQDWFMDTIRIKYMPSVIYPVTVQLIENGIRIHKDLGRYLVLNFIIDPGGNQVRTIFYNNKKDIISSYIIETKRWHTLTTDIFHTVEGIQDRRISISVKLK